MLLIFCLVCISTYILKMPLWRLNICQSSGNCRNWTISTSWSTEFHSIFFIKMTEQLLLVLPSRPIFPLFSLGGLLSRRSQSCRIRSVSQGRNRRGPQHARRSTFHRERHTSAQPCIQKGTAMHTKYTSQAVQPIDKTATHRGMKRWQSAVQCSAGCGS